MSYNIEDYEPVQDRIVKFYEKYSDGRIDTILHSMHDGKVIFKAVLYACKEDYQERIILATGWAQEVEGQGYVNKTSHLENCETSAIGRALANIGLSGDKRASREEMEKVERSEESAADQVQREFHGGVVESTQEKKYKGKLDFIEVRAALENIDTLQKIQDYRKQLWKDYPKMSEKQVSALKSIFQERESKIKEVDTAVEQTMFGDNAK